METTSFDALNRPLTVKYPTNEIVTLTYDREGEQSLLAGTDSLVGNVTYNARGQLVLLDRGGSAPDSTYLYHPQNDAANGGLGDSNFRLKTIQHGAAGTGNAFPDFTYEYDLVGNISKLTTLSTAGTDTQTFVYDDLNRLTTAAATGGIANYSQTYTYSQLGNITSFAGTGFGYGQATGIAAGAKPHAVTHYGGVQKFWYDANGNMTTRIEGSTTYTQVFDVENRLTSVTPSGGSATTFAYDANGIRNKTVQPGGITTYFPFPGYEETVNGANTIKRSTYSFAGQTVALRVSGDPVSGNNGLFYVLSDHLGSTSMLVNSSGGAVAGSTTRNLPFGGYRTAPTQTITDRDFTGQKENMELGLLYYNARFYVPGIGRFLSADTLVPGPANPQSFNRYSYVENRPILFRDPTGHISCTDSNLPGDDQQACLTTQPQPPANLPPHPPSGLNDDYGQPAWDGLQAIQQMSGGWWGTELDAEEAIMLILNHELGDELRPDGHSAPRDVLINQYNAYCSGGVWSAECLNKFWGYSHVIRESRVALDGGERFANAGHVQWLRETAAGFLDHTIQSVNPALMHYGNAFGDSAQRLLQDYNDGVVTYATYVSVSGYATHPVTKQFILDANNNRIVSSVFAVQTYSQWQLTGTLQYWTYPQ